MPSFRQPGTVLTDHVFEVPLDHDVPDGEQITVFAREVVATPGVAAGGRDDLPCLVFLQGGPGRPSPRRRTLAGLSTPQAQAAYLAHFRADSIVADAELIRARLTGGRPWSVLGQSFGGFCAVTYLSQAPDGLAEAFITGGLPGLETSADDVYRATYPLVAARNAAHYERYPADVEQARRIARHLAAHEVTLPSGARLTVPAFQSLGICLGMSTGSDQLHYLLDDALDSGQVSDDFLYRAQSALTFAPGPLFGALHEACYAQGAATRWSAHRIRAEFGEFDAQSALDGDAPVFFTGEMIYPWMFEVDPLLRPLAEAAEILAQYQSWPCLYDPGRLGSCEVPAAAAVYYDDMYVPQQFSLDTAARVGGLKRWVTSEFHHDGLRASGGAVLDRLIGMVRGTI